MRLDNMPIRDFTTFPTSLMRGPSVPATVSLDVQWRGVTKVDHIRDAAHDFALNLLEDTATVQWKAQEAGFSFASDAASTSQTEFAEVGIERNGVFFPTASPGRG